MSTILKTLAILTGIHIPSIVCLFIALFVTNEPWWAGWMFGYAILIIILFPLALIAMSYILAGGLDD